MIRAPGPRGWPILGSLLDLRADPLAFLDNAARDHGDVVRLRFGPVTAHLLTHPDHIDRVLSRRSRVYDKATRSARRIAATTGDSLLSADAETWVRHRRLIQPAFQPGALDGIAPVLDTLLEPMLDRWIAGGDIDIVSEMMDLVIAAALRFLFSSDIDPRRITAPLDVLLADTWRRIEAPVDASLLTPRLHRPAFRRAVAAIDAIVLDIIAARRRAAAPPDDILSRLLEAHGEGGDTRLTDRELRDVAVTLLLAGHETTANALSWAVIHAAGEGHELADPDRIFAEALRLHPSIWIIERRAVEEDDIAGYRIPRGSSVLISPYLMHRRADFWPDPTRFDPARFADATPKAADGYLPFGLGPHRCVGLHLAKGIARHVIRRVFATVRLRRTDGSPLVSDPGLTLRPAGPVPMEVRAL